MLPTPYVASLRVYEPLWAFDNEVKQRWSEINNDSKTKINEQVLALRRTIGFDQLSFLDHGAHVLDESGVRYVAPWSTKTRCWAALEEFKSSLPSSILRFYITANHEEILRANSSLIEDKVTHIITATWSIPPRWFALFQPSDRKYGITDYGSYTLLRSSIFEAKQRCTFAHEVVLNAFGPGPVEIEIALLLNWLSLFHENSIIECDYGGLASYLEKSLIDNGEKGLESDTSIEDVANSLAGLAAGDGRLAGKGYERLVSRWRRVAAFEQAF